jgi:hypothetical protein
MLMSIFVMGTRSIAEGFASIWSGLMLFLLSIGGTMIMRKFHNSMAVGFFMGSVVATSQMFFLLFLMYVFRKRVDWNGLIRNAILTVLSLCSYSTLSNHDYDPCTPPSIRLAHVKFLVSQPQ